MKLSLDDIMSLDKNYRIKLINSISGYKGVHLIATQNSQGNSNVAIFNSVVHIGASPPMLGFIMRPISVERHTYENIKSTGHYTINHVHEHFIKQAHYTSAKFPDNDSEFIECGLDEHRTPDFEGVFVKQSKIKLGLRLKEDIEIQSNGTHLIVGEVKYIWMDDNVVQNDGQLDLEVVSDVCVTGLNQYSKVSKLKSYPYARLSELPSFKNIKRADNVVYDETTDKYHSRLLPYGTNIGAPSIKTDGLATWKTSSVKTFNHHFTTKVDEIKKSYQELIEEYETNELLYHVNMNFEPIVGQTYHLYESKNNEAFLSLIPPTDWQKKHLGDYMLTHEKVWKKIA